MFVPQLKLQGFLKMRTLRPLATVKENVKEEDEEGRQSCWEHRTSQRAINVAEKHVLLTHQEIPGAFYLSFIGDSDYV